ncbi:hypothetical protein CDL15_Pgr007224 [Punica granatum]|uniref:Uncharacterized protein n=1 Tax=Punica granatum TaxID=22663 RepID=A0A218X8E0_PUNGR|nr:hypothetical protein CDL15_Pgr007224 [Punica granatum]
MGGGHGHGEGTTYKGFTVHQPKRWHAVTGKGLCAIMWVGDIRGRAMEIPMAMEVNMSHLTEKQEAGSFEDQWSLRDSNVANLCSFLFNKTVIMMRL